jgi:hypothetical protein
MVLKVWLRRRSTKLQAPNPRQYPNSNFELSKRICFRNWSFGDLTLFGVWDLDIGIFPPRRDLVPAMPR